MASAGAKHSVHLTRPQRCQKAGVSRIAGACFDTASAMSLQVGQTFVLVAGISHSL